MKMKDLAIDDAAPPTAEDDLFDTLQLMRREAMRVSRLEDATAYYIARALHAHVNEVARRYGWTIRAGGVGKSNRGTPETTNDEPTDD